jgi:hypothetical protein
MPNGKQSFRESVLEFFSILKEEGITHPDMAKIEVLYKNGEIP